MAYFWAKHAYAPYHVSLDYRRLDYRRGERFRGDVWLSREAFLQVKQARIAARVLGLDGQVLYSREEDVVLEDGRHSSLCMALDFPVPDRQIFAVRVSAESPGHRDETLYYFPPAAMRFTGLTGTCLSRSWRFPWWRRNRIGWFIPSPTGENGLRCTFMLRKRRIAP